MRWTVVLLLAAVLAVAACDNDGSQIDLIATATDGPQITITPLPSTPTPPPTFAAPPTIGIPPTPAPRTPTPAAEGGRPDCPQDWAVYSDPSGYFSICYPADWRAISAARYRPDFGAGFSVWSTDVNSIQTDSVYMTVYWKKTNAFDLGIRRERCSVVDDWRDVREITLTVDGRDVPACTGDIFDFEAVDPGPALFQGTFAEVPIASGEGYLVLFQHERIDLSEADHAVLSAVLQSLRVGQ